MFSRAIKMTQMQQRVLDALDQMDKQAQRETAEFAEQMADLFPKPVTIPTLTLVVSNVA
jgi:hypothetical protein